MKKALFLLVFIALLLTSCGVNITKSPVDPNVFYLDSLPDIGEFSGKADGGRFYDEVTYDFIPSDEYGMILPYIGSYRVFETPKDQEWYTGMGYASYGFCTPDGKIVMDASDVTNNIYYRQTDDGFGYYTVTRQVNQKQDAPDEYIPSETWIVPLDGSWCLRLGPRSWLSNAGGGYIYVCEYLGDMMSDGVCTRVYGYDGKLEKTVDDIDSTGIYSCGLLLVSEWKDNTYSASFVNDNGEKVLGPYKSASDFTQYGITAVEDENGAYIVNTEGERLTDYYKSFFKEYSLDMEQMVFCGRRMDDNKTSDIYSNRGEYLGSLTGSTYFSFRFPDNGEIYGYHMAYNNDKYQTVSEEMVWRRLSDGAEFVSEEFGKAPNSYTGTDNCYIRTDKDDKCAYVFDGNGKTVATLDSASDVIAVSEYGEYIIYTVGEYEYGTDPETGLPYEDTRVTYVYDSKAGENIYSVSGKGASAYFADENKRFILMMVYDRMDMYDIFGSDPKYTLLDTQSGKVVFENCNQIQLFGIGTETYINVCTDNSLVLYDDDFDVIRKVYFE